MRLSVLILTLVPASAIAEVDISDWKFPIRQHFDEKLGWCGASYSEGHTNKEVNFGNGIVGQESWFINQDRSTIGYLTQTITDCRVGTWVTIGYQSTPSLLNHDEEARHVKLAYEEAVAYFTNADQFRDDPNRFIETSQYASVFVDFDQVPLGSENEPVAYIATGGAGVESCACSIFYPTIAGSKVPYNELTYSDVQGGYTNVVYLIKPIGETDDRN